ncbi:hypothetical protein RBB50_002868 [Rhinocladiella similis]
MQFPSPTKAYHAKVYADIDPTSPHLSTKGKNVVITGGGTGIGAATAEAFAASGASSISILGRTEKTLLNTKQRIEKKYPDTQVSTYVADLVDKSSVDTALATVHSTQGQINILVANAGSLSSLGPLEGMNDPQAWYEGFEINVKGNLNLILAFLPYRASDAAVIHISTALVHAPYFANMSGYHTSKLAAAKLFDYLHYEHPSLFVLNVHPGVIESGMNKSNDRPGPAMDFDDSKS